VQLVGATAGFVLGLVVPLIDVGPMVSSGRMAELLFTLGVGTLGITTVVFSLLFGVVQWTASTYSPRLTLFHRDPLVWRAFGLAIGVFTFAVTAGLSTGVDGQVTVVLPTLGVMAVLLVAVLIRELQNRAYKSMQLASVVAALVANGHTAIAQAYPPASVPATTPDPPTPTGEVRTVSWSGKLAVVQQLELRRMVTAASRADACVTFRVPVGGSVHPGTILAEVRGGHLEDHVVRRAVVADAERSFAQDPLLAFRLLADIALRALSPAVNDPATAVDTLDGIHDLLRDLADRDLEPPDIVDDLGVCRARILLPSWEAFLRTGVEDLLPAASSSPMVLDRVVAMLTDLLAVARVERRASVVRLRDRASSGLQALALRAVTG
jgi:uncharacterized membrane protein